MSGTVTSSDPRAAIYDLVVGLAFWLAILLAFAYPVVLFAIDRGFIAASTLVPIITVHFLALFAGRGYGTTYE